MNVYKKIGLILVILFFSYIIFVLQKKRQHIQSNMLNNIYEGFSTDPTENEYNNLTKFIDRQIPVSIANMAIDDLPLNQYCIKSSFNTAITKTCCNVKMISFVLKRGCRFLDFEIYNIDNTPKINYSNDFQYVNLSSSNSITVTDAFKQIAIYGFNGNCPNPNDPLFIQLRIKDKKADTYNKIADIIKNTIGTKQYSGIVDATNTPLGSLKNNVVIVFDKSLVPDYFNLFPNFAKYVNMESGGERIAIYKYNNIIDRAYTPPQIRDDGISTDVLNMKEVIPSNIVSLFGSVSNPEYYPLPFYYGVQIAVYPFYYYDTNLQMYETIFNHFKTAFVPLSKMNSYLETKI